MVDRTRLVLNTMISTENNNPFEIESRRAYAVFDAESGAIVHVHRITTFRGGKALPLDQHEARALEMAKRMGHETERLRVVRVDPEERMDGQRVDLESLKLVPDPAAKEFESHTRKG